MRVHRYVFLPLLLLLGSLGLQAQTGLTAEIQQLEKDMYRYYGTDSVEQFTEATKQLKAACLAAGDERTFYKAWGNQAIFYFNRVSRTEGLKTARELHDYAKWHDSKFGLYTSTYVMGTVLSGFRQLDDAEKSFREAIDYQHRYFPKESAAAPYLAMAKIEFNRGHFDKVVEYGRKAKAEPGVNPQHVLTGGSYECLGLAKQIVTDADRAEFNRVYAERAKVKEQIGHDDTFGATVEVYYQLVNRQYERALEQAQSLRAPMARLEMTSQAYAQMGRYKEAYEWQLRYRRHVDSVNTAELRLYAVEVASQIHLARAESESKNLRSTNQNLIYGIIAVLVLGFVFYLLYRIRQMRKLQAVNRQLAQANQQLAASEQAEHKARQQAEKALEVKRLFLNNISHEMRTPLNSICGFAEVLTMPGLELPDEEKQDLNQRVNESAQLLTGIIDKMLELAYYDSLSHIERTDRVDVNAMCRRLMDDYREHTAGDVELKLLTSLADGDTLVTHQACLERVLRHVLDNAARFTPAGGTITLDVSLPQAPGMAQFAVSDTGPGIPQEIQKAVFEEFVDTGGEVKTTGMGLSISHTICQLLGGKIWVDSSYTDGCRIIFQIKSV